MNVCKSLILFLSSEQCLYGLRIMWMCYVYGVNITVAQSQGCEDLFEFEVGTLRWRLVLATFSFKFRNSGGLNSQTSGASSSSSLPSIRIQTQDKEGDFKPRRTKKGRTTKYFRKDFEMYKVQDDPNDLREALSSVDANLWQEAINYEMGSLKSNRIWYLVDLPLAAKQ